uniref:Uncharacterized protein n=1 Tax=Arundo donax TaxID=35708 RepID=A0A0A9ARA3_ARUDO
MLMTSCSPPLPQHSFSAPLLLSSRSSP